MALGSTQHLTEMSKGGRYVRLTALPPSCAVVMKSGNLNFLEPSGLLRACNGTALPSYLYGLVCGIVIKIETVIARVSALILEINMCIADIREE